MISECNLTGNSKEWFVDTGATRHICANKWMFSNYKPVTQEEKLIMGNSSTSKVEGKGKITLKMTSGKELTLNDILHVPDIRKNLVSGSLLSKNGFKLVFVSDNFVLSKNGLYVGKVYVSDGLFKMNVITIVPKDYDNKVKSSIYIVESSNIWHARLGPVNFDTLRKMINLDFIPKFAIDSNYKCEICTEAKMTKTSFHHVERNTEPLNLIHIDICDLKLCQTR